LTSAILRRTNTAKISGIDFSAPYVEHARQTIPDARAQFSVGDICALPQDGGSFDRVLSLIAQSADCWPRVLARRKMALAQKISA
jgi:ubiquinone/menaquinone biosynthesis C-methylase UbiE